ncbi:DMT family transporter [Pseudonocardia alni]|uniref:DMT family transporter n=1 Tax=Pseudonocardia alni TaxID=33907 RepID=UPI003571669F
MDRILSAVFVMIWSSGFLIGSVATRHVPPFALSFWRFVAAGVILTAVAVALQRQWPRQAAGWRDAAVAGVLLQGLQFGAGYLAMAWGVSPGLVALLVCSAPVLVAILAGPLLGERLGRRGWVGTLLALAGVVVVGNEHLHGGGSVSGLMAAVVASVSLAAGTIYQKRSGAAVDVWPGAAVQAFAAAAVVAPATLLLEGGPEIPSDGVGVAAWGWLTVINSVVGVAVLLVMLRRSAGTAVSGLLYVVPPATVLLSVPVLGQQIDVGTVAGLVLTLVGAVLVDRAVGRSVRPDHRISSARGGDHGMAAPSG